MGLSLLCLYILTSEITAIGSFFKKHCQRFYRKNILFFNLVRQKGRQYTLSLFVSTILIAVAIFGTGFIGAVFLDNYFSIKEDPYDYSLLTSFQQKDIDQAEIEKLARDYNIEIENFKTFMFFIAIIAFISAVMVIGLKILGTLWQDNESYRKAVFLGLKEQSLNRLISKQISLIYYYPTFAGCAVGILMINQIIVASSSAHPGAVTLIAVLSALAIVLLQIVIYLFLRKSIITHFKVETET